MEEGIRMWRVSFQEGDVSPSWSTLVEDLAVGSTQAETDGFSEPWRQFTFFRSLAEVILSFNSNKLGAMGGGCGIWKFWRKEKCSEKLSNGCLHRMAIYSEKSALQLHFSINVVEEKIYIWSEFHLYG